MQKEHNWAIEEIEDERFSKHMERWKDKSSFLASKW